MHSGTESLVLCKTHNRRNTPVFQGRIMLHKASVNEMCKLFLYSSSEAAAELPGEIFTVGYGLFEAEGSIYCAAYVL